MITESKDLILTTSQLIEFREKCRQQSKKVVFASGIYDILHEGHLKFLEKARKCGDVLIVGINDDVFARTKGMNRPIQSEYNRARLVAGFECVSCVHIFDNSNEIKNIIHLVEPDVYIMSTTSARKPKDRPGHFKAMEKLGGQVVIFNACSTSHSTSLIEKIKAKG